MSEARPDSVDPTAERIEWPERRVRTKRVAILASGSGTTFEAIGEAWREGKIEAGSLTLIVTNPKVEATRRAQRLDITCAAVDLRRIKNPVKRGDLLKREMDERGIDFAHCAGMTLIVDGDILKMPITNTHPAPLPDDPDRRAYGGYKMIGMKVHEKIADDYHRGLGSRAGSTIHLVDDQPDHGGIVRVSSYDIAERARRETVDPALVTAEDIATWTQADEKRNNVEVLAAICRDQRLSRLPDVETA